MAGLVSGFTAQLANAESIQRLPGVTIALSDIQEPKSALEEKRDAVNHIDVITADEINPSPGSRMHAHESTETHAPKSNAAHPATPVPTTM